LEKAPFSNIDTNGTREFNALAVVKGRLANLILPITDRLITIMKK